VGEGGWKGGQGQGQGRQGQEGQGGQGQAASGRPRAAPALGWCGAATPCAPSGAAVGHGGRGGLARSKGGGGGRRGGVWTCEAMAHASTVAPQLWKASQGCLS